MSVRSTRIRSRRTKLACHCAWLATASRPRYQDQEPGYVTLHGRGSVAALAATIAEPPKITETRFRSNIAIDGVDAWEEQRWIGRSPACG
jgi:uncharacterized protein YcbX